MTSGVGSSCVLMLICRENKVYSLKTYFASKSYYFVMCKISLRIFKNMVDIDMHLTIHWLVHASLYNQWCLSPSTPTRETICAFNNLHNCMQFYGFLLKLRYKGTCQQSDVYEKCHWYCIYYFNTFATNMKWRINSSHTISSVVKSLFICGQKYLPKSRLPQNRYVDVPTGRHVNHIYLGGYSRGDDIIVPLSH